MRRRGTSSEGEQTRFVLQRQCLGCRNAIPAISWDRTKNYLRQPASNSWSFKKVAEQVGIGFELPADKSEVAPYCAHTELLSHVAQVILFQEEGWLPGLDSN